MLKSGIFHEFKISKKRNQITTCNTAQNQLIKSISKSKQQLNTNNNQTATNNNLVCSSQPNNNSTNGKQLNNKAHTIEMSRLVETDNVNPSLMANEDDLQSISTTFDEAKSSGMGEAMTSAMPGRKKRQFIKKLKRNRDIKLALLMVFSASFIVFVLPEVLLNIYEYQYVASNGYIKNIFDTHDNSSSVFDSARFYHEIKNFCVYFKKLRNLKDAFILLKLINYSSNYMAYLTLVTFSRRKSSSINSNKRSKFCWFS
jgi:hypothetical protein